VKDPVLAYAAGETVKTMDLMKTLYDFKTGDETACPVDKVYRYAAVGDYPASPDKEGAFEELNFVMDAAVQKRNTIIFAIGSTKGD
jgi:hypothetical protein